MNRIFDRIGHPIIESENAFEEGGHHSKGFTAKEFSKTASLSCICGAGHCISHHFQLHPDVRYYYRV
jgi:hypothetical protein